MSSSLTFIKQGPDETFADFVHRLMTAAGRIFGSTDTGVDFVKQLAFENANAACQAAIQPYKTKTDLSGYICLCSDIGSAYQQDLAMAAALQGITVKQFLAQQNKIKCFACGEIGHLLRTVKLIRDPPSDHRLQACVPDVKEESTGLMNVNLKWIPRVNSYPRTRETGTGASPRPQNQNKSMGQ